MSKLDRDVDSDERHNAKWTLAVLLAIVVLVAMASLAKADSPRKYPEFITFNGFAFAWPKNPDDTSPNREIVKYDYLDAVRGKKPRVANCEKWVATTANNVRWCFANESNFAAFNKKTDKDGVNEYASKLFVGGRCALGTSWGYPAAKGDPRTAKIQNTPTGSVVVLQSHQKWIPVYNELPDMNRGIANAAYNIGKAAGIIVKNGDESPEPVKK